MVIRWKKGADSEAKQRVRRALDEAGVVSQAFDGALVVQSGEGRWMETLACDPSIDEIVSIDAKYRLTARAARPTGSIVDVAGVQIGGDSIIVAGGPCSVEDETQIHATAAAVARAGGRLLRGGAWKPRTSPYEFQGHGARGLELLAAAGRAHGLPIVTEVLGTEDLPLVARVADMIQVGARNAQNTALLKALGAAEKPVLLKRGAAMTLEELLCAAEYVMAHGNPNVILCERGMRTFERATRNTLDLASVAALKRMTHLPVLVDPSHATGRRDLVVSMSIAAIAAGADGLLVEVHPRPDASWSDAAQAIDPATFESITRAVAIEAAVRGKRLDPLGSESVRRDRMHAIDDAIASLLESRTSLARDLTRDGQRFRRDAAE
ncbi:MAG: 3-deoxy-7-phosphoheptulonate synthase [Polyangiales bacterium]